MVSICVLDYGLGNLRSVKEGFERVGADVSIARDPDEVVGDGVVVPGVGAFEDGIKDLRDMKPVLLDLIENDVPVLGICLGMQMFFSRSFEGGEWVSGLDIFEGDVVRFDNTGFDGADFKVPHMGWSRVRPVETEMIQRCPKKQRLSLSRDRPVRTTGIFDGLGRGGYFYFAHSYYVEPSYEEDILANTIHGVEFPSAVSKDNVFGVQFHPEKSGKKGLKVLKNFLELSREK